MTLEDQLAALEAIGICLCDDVSIEDLLYSFDRTEYESKPFDTLLFVLGIEVERDSEAQFFSNDAWNFDVECIVETGDYVQIVNRLAKLANVYNRITDVSDFIDIDQGVATLQYKLDGQLRTFAPTVDDDWADPETINSILADFEHDGCYFYGIDNGQATILYFLSEANAEQFRALAADPVTRMVN